MSSEDIVYHAKAPIKEGLQAGTIGAGVGLLVSAVQNSVGTHSHGATGVVARTGSTIGVFGKLSLHSSLTALVLSIDIDITSASAPIEHILPSSAREIAGKVDLPYQQSTNLPLGDPSEIRRELERGLNLHDLKSGDSIQLSLSSFFSFGVHTACTNRFNDSLQECRTVDIYHGSFPMYRTIELYYLRTWRLTRVFLFLL